MALRLVTAGESHGPALVAVLEGLPAGLPVDAAAIDALLSRRQGGYGRGGRQRIEEDRVEILAGLRGGRTLGSPLALVVRNRDATLERLPPVTRPRPGHADLAGMLKFHVGDARDVLERASARGTAAVVAAGAVAKLLLREAAGVRVEGFVRAVGGVEARVEVASLEEMVAARDADDFATCDPAAAARWRGLVDSARAGGDTLGGVVEVWADGVPPGLGGCRTREERLDARLAAALMGVPAIKGVEIGIGFEAARLPGSRAHDPILPPAGEGGLPRRASNHAGGIEGGMTNGERVVVRAAMKPLSSLRDGLPSVDSAGGGEAPGARQRTDTCAVPAASVVAEGVVALELAAALLEKTGGDTLAEVRRAVAAHLAAAAAVFAPGAPARRSSSGAPGSGT